MTVEEITAAGLAAATAVARWARVDMEETCRGPLEWDLAALAAYLAVAGTAVPTAAMLAPFTRVRELEAAVWVLCMAWQYPARHRGIAQDLPARVRAGGLA